MQLELASLNLEVDLLPKVLAFLRACSLNHVDARHLIYCLVKLRRTVAVRGSQMAAGGVWGLRAAAIALILLIFREVTW